MNGLLLVIQTISDFLWGTPMTIALIGTGLYLSIKFKFRYITKIKFHFQNTFGKMFKGKGEGEGTVSGFAAACTAMANTIGVGNIGGVATAITMGGPGAIFWMWISALLGMSTKACEIILGQRYRVKYKNSTFSNVYSSLKIVTMMISVKIPSMWFCSVENASMTIS